MKKIFITILLVSLIAVVPGCGNRKVKVTSESFKKMELTGNLVTHVAYFHNVLEYNKDKGKGLDGFLEKDRRMFVEYTGTVKLGIDLKEVHIDDVDNGIKVFVPKAKIIGDPNIDDKDFSDKKFIESNDAFFNKNPITNDDVSEAMDKAQKEVRKNTLKDEDSLALAQKRAKVLIEEKLCQFSGLEIDDLNITWEYGQ